MTLSFPILFVIVGQYPDHSGGAVLFRAYASQEEAKFEMDLMNKAQPMLWLSIMACPVVWNKEDAD